MGQIEMTRECKRCGFFDQQDVVGIFTQEAARAGDYRKWFACPGCQKSLSVLLRIIRGVGVVKEPSVPQEATCEVEEKEDGEF